MHPEGAALPHAEPGGILGLRDLLGPFRGISHPKVSCCCSYLKNQHWGTGSLLLCGVPEPCWCPHPPSSGDKGSLIAVPG